ncbi:MAG: DMT family transporter [Pseudomonadota bacterium]
MVSANLKGGLFMALAMAAFTFNDALVKLLALEHPLFQVIFLRGLLTTFVFGLVVLVFFRHHVLPHLPKPIVWIRAFCEVGATIFFLTGLTYLPIANTAAILSALPLVVTMGDALFFRAPVGWRRWSAILVGFFGVLIIIRPGFEGFSVYSLLIVVCVIFAAARDLVTKVAPADLPSPVFALVTSIAISATGAVGSAFSFEPFAFSINDLVYLSIAALFLVGAYYFIIEAMRHGEVAAVAPYRYTNLIWAVLIGVLVFGDPVEWQMVVGSLIIVATGIYTFYRERKRAFGTSEDGQAI